jgi:hypothetical protein
MKTCEENGIVCDHYDHDLKNTIISGPNCTDMGALLHHWFTFNNDYNIQTDFYAEVPFTKDVIKKPTYTIDTMDENKNYTVFPYKDSWLALATDIMSPCFQVDKNACPYGPNVHSHYVDIRFHEIDGIWFSVNIFDQEKVIDYMLDHFNEQTIHDFLLIVNTLLTNAVIIMNAFLKPNNYDKNIQVLWDMVSNLKDETMKDIFVERLNNIHLLLVKRGDQYMHRIAWQLLKLNNPMANTIKKYILDQTSSISDIILDVLSTNTQDIYDDDHAIDFIKYVYSQLLDIGVLLMDTYTLARMFGQVDSTQIVVYAGEYHILNYAYFFEQYLHADRVFAIENDNDSKCLSSDLLPDYLNMNKFRIHMYYKSDAIKILNENDKIYIPKYKNWKEINIIRNKNQYTVSFVGIDGNYTKIWNKKDVINFLIQVIYYNENK